jgi:hypothetical protein
MQYQGTAAERDALTSMSPGDEFHVSSGTGAGSMYMYTGAGWSATRSNGAAVVSDGFKPSQDYISDLVMNGTAQAVALASGTNRVVIWNQGATTETIRYAFGTSQANAEANLTISAAAATTGIKVPAYADFGILCMTNPIGVPALATHIAIANAVAADTQAVQLIQGV